MFFQPTLLNDESFAAFQRKMHPFPMHWHNDIEILFSLQGSFLIRMEKEEYEVRAGDIVFVGSCEPHEIVFAEEPNSALHISVGSLFCGSEIFQSMIKTRFKNPVLKQDADIARTVNGILHIINGHYDFKGALELRGRLYTILSLIFRKIKDTSSITENHHRRLMTVMKVQRALDLVATRYNENITLEDAALTSGYEKSAFCRMFRNATGYTFHKYLNDYRIKKAIILLEENHCSIAEAAYQVGFAQQKNFCKLFKDSMGITPSEYRKNNI